MRTQIFQIFYDDESKKKILPGFIPLDNTNNLRPDWFEFWVILNFLRHNPLEENTWYGFLSPKFFEKTNLNSNLIFDVINLHGEDSDVALFSHGWDQIAYFLNPFEQGEVWHPGLMQASQNFISNCGINIDLKLLVCDSTSTVFSNYIIARKSYWVQWKRLAELFFEYVEINSMANTMTNYGSTNKNYPLKTFIQERLVTLILSLNSFRVISIDQSFSAPIFTRLFPDDLETRRLLQACDLLKIKFREKADEEYLKMYWRIRGDIIYSNLNFI